MNLKLPRYQSIPADEWPEYLAMLLGVYWFIFSSLIPGIGAMPNILGTILGLSVAHFICESHYPGADAAPRLRARYYLRVGAVYLALVLALKVLLGLFVFAIKALGGASV